MSEYTPGPWTFYADLPSTAPNWHIVTNASRKRVVANVHIEPGNEVDLANARLIAAAPDLLEALRDAQLTLDYAAVYLTYEDGSLGTIQLAETRKAINAAIAKATGVHP